MPQKTNKTNKTNRIPLYEKVGKYFTPDGRFNEEQFRKLLIENFADINNSSSDKQDFQKNANEWLSQYLDEIMDYLVEKGMYDASTSLLRVATDECVKVGLDKIKISPDQLQSLLTKIPPAAEQGIQKMSKDEKKRVIFEAALQVFAEEGYHKATIDKIASLSGVGKGSVYRYFKSKEELLDQLLIEKYEEIIEKVSYIFSDEGNLLDQLEEVIDFWLRFIENNHVLYKLIQNEAIAQKSGNSRRMIYDYIITNLPMIKERIVALNKDKKLKTTSFYSVFYGVLGFMDGVVHKWFVSGRSYPLINEKPIILEVLFNGFVGESATRKRYYRSPGE